MNLALVVSEGSCFIKQNNKWAILLLLINPNAVVVFLVEGHPKEAIVDKTVDGRTYGLTTDKDLLEKLTLEHFHTQVS